MPFLPLASAPGVLVLHASWGLNASIKAFCTRLSEAGFVAFALDLYHGKVANTIPEAQALGKVVDDNHLQAEAEVADAALFLHERVGPDDRGLAVIGFSLGGYYALQLAGSDPEHVRSVVLFYATDGMVGGDYRNSSSAYLGHYAENDQFEPQSNVDYLEQTLKRAGRPVTFYVYPGTGHSFFDSSQPAYNPAASSLAWDRTLTFLKRSSTS